MLSKALISNVDEQGNPATSGFHVPFNPNEITIQEACTTSKAGTSDDTQNEQTGDHTQLTLNCTLFFNTYISLSQSSYEDVRNYVRKLYPYTNYGREKEQNLKKIAFTWGSICVIGILKQLQVKYTMFSPSGIPVRCEVDIAIDGTYFGEKQGSVMTVEEEDLKEQVSFLDTIANYCESDEWKRLARENDLGKVRSA